ERTYFLDVARQQSVDASLARWDDARTTVVATIDAAESLTSDRAVAPVRSALSTYEREFGALRDRVTLQGIAATDPAGVAGAPMRTAFAQLIARAESLSQDTAN